MRSGAGKTTFVDVLAGRVDYCGSYSMNGREVSAESIREKSAYVQQEDMFFPYLTVREHLWFQAQLRLPSTMPAEEKHCAYCIAVAALAWLSGHELAISCD